MAQAGLVLLGIVLLPAALPARVQEQAQKSHFSENANNAVANVPSSHYLQKPYSPTSLASMIREILDVT